jgi:hypothetical protein
MEYGTDRKGAYLVRARIPAHLRILVQLIPIIDEGQK